MLTFFIDTSVFISTLKPDHSTQECKRFMSRVKNGDILHVTCAKILCIPLVTIDGKLLRSRGLKEQGVEIIHPLDAVNRM